MHVKIRRILSALLALTLLMWAACAEEGFAFDFDDEGYTGDWLNVPALGIELCLPDGWTQAEAAEGLAFAATKDDGTAAMAISVTDTGVADLIEWADANLGDYSVDTTGFFDTVLTEQDDAVAIYRLDDGGQVLAFSFDRADADAVSAAFALEIVDSVNESWADEGDPQETEP